MEAPATPAARTGRRVEVGGEAIHLLEQGTGPPLLLIHGFPSNALAWSLVMHRLGGRFRLLAPDMVGFGRSTRRPRHPLTGDAYADRLAGLLHELGIDRTDVAGVSWGSEVAQRLALRHPQRVRRLVLAAPLHAGHPMRLSDGNLMGMALGRLAPPLARLAVRRYLRRATRGDLPAEQIDEVVRGYVDPLRVPGTIPFLRRFVRATQLSQPADVSAIAAPTLVVLPDADRVVPPTAGRRLATDIPAARLEVLPGVGHAVQFEAADRLSQLIDAFLGDGTADG